MTQNSYHYHMQARRPGTYLAMGVGMATAYVVHATSTTIAWLPVGAYLAIVLYRLLKNPSAGLRLGAHRLEVYAGENRQSFPLARIRAARVRKRFFSLDECVLDLSDGGHEALPPEALPPARRLCAELAARGVPLAD